MLVSIAELPTKKAVQNDHATPYEPLGSPLCVMRWEDEEIERNFKFIKLPNPHSK